LRETRDVKFMFIRRGAPFSRLSSVNVLHTEDQVLPEIDKLRVPPALFTLNE